MQHLLLALAIVLLTIIAGNANRKKRQEPIVIKVGKEAQKKTVIQFSSHPFSVWASRFEMIAN
ncbi:MAG TPA: hypothetical protein VM187_05175 [Niastella sp.]|nr:hypothetical protein [Niastella sp.]